MARRDPISQLRSGAYRTGRVLGDVQAVRKGTIGKRIARRVLGRLFTRIIRALVR